MAERDLIPKLAALRSLEASLHLHKCAQAARVASARASEQVHTGTSPWYARLPRCGCILFSDLVIVAAHMGSAFNCLARSMLGRLDGRKLGLRVRAVFRVAMRRRGLRIAAGTLGGLVLFVVLTLGGLWWRLASGPISLDMATPWLTAAIAENLGQRYQIEVGGTVIELDENRRMAVRLRDVVVRDRNGIVIASAPKAEAGFTPATLLSGRPRAESINLVGAEIALRVESDGKIAVFAGAEKQPIATAPVLAAAGTVPVTLPVDADPKSAVPGQGIGESFAAVLSWIDSLGTLGLDGGDLAEVGLKSGNLVIDDQRNGRKSRFENIQLSVTRPQPGELSVTLGSQNPERPWVVVGAVKPTGQGSRAVRIEARKVALHDILMAVRADAGVDTDLPISASLRAEIAADGTPQFASGRVLFGPGEFGEAGNDSNKIAIDRFEANLEWDAQRGMVVSPFQLVSGNTRMTLIAQAEVPSDPAAPWKLALRGGSVVVASASGDETPLLLNRVLIRGNWDPATRRLDILQGEAGGMDVNVALSGFVDLSTADPKLAVGLAARNMSAASFVRMWPPFVNTPVREWVLENMSGGMIDRIEIATNAPFSTLRQGGPPVPDDGLSMEIVSSGTKVRLLEALPEIRDSDLVMRVRGRQVNVALGHGVAELPSGRRLMVSNGLFEVPDSQGPKPPARVRVRIDGPAQAAAEFLTLDRIREASGAPLDPSNCRGTISAQVNVATTLEADPPPEAFSYNVAADLTNFGVDRFVLGQKVEAQTLRVTANQQGYQLKGDVRIGGTPANVEYRKGRTEAEAEVRLQAVLDDAARNRLGIDLGGALAGPVPIKLAGRMPISGEQDNRLTIEADLTQAKIDNLLPGWVKPAGKSVKSSLTYVGRGKAARIEDAAIEGSGAAIKGGVELDGNGELLTATFPVFGLSDGDKSNLKVERAPDGMLKIVLRGDVYDGRSFVKSAMGGGGGDQKNRRSSPDVDIDMKIGVLAGFNGEALRAVDLRLVRRGGKLENLSLHGKIGDANLVGDLRGRVGGGGQVVYFESNDAGALFRFTDTYARMFGGQMWVAMDPPSADPHPKDGLLNVRDFVVRGEPALDRVAAGGSGTSNPGVEFTRMRVEFSRSAGRLAIRDGVVRGPVVGATLEGVLDYAAGEVRMRGTFVPLYGLNNAFGQIPIVGLFLGGGSNEGLLGVTYEVVGTPGAPVLRVNPISAVAPGVLRKFFEFPSTMSGQTGGPGFGGNSTNVTGATEQRYPDNRSSVQ